MTQSSSLPPVFFNHLYVVLDDKTYHAIQGSDFLRIAFPGVERRATLTAAGETWNGTYFYCQDTYLEFFGSGNSPVTGQASRSGHWQAGAQEGWAGLAFSTDRPGGVAAVRQVVSDALGYQPFTELRQMHSGEKAINWFYQVKLAELLGLGSFDSWVMEYHPDIFASKGIPLPEDGSVSRRAYLAQWNQERAAARAETGKEPGAMPESSTRPAAEATNVNTPRKAASVSHTPSRAGTRSVLSPSGFSGLPVFSRLTGATIHMDARRAERFAEILSLFGYSRETSGDTLALSAHGFTLSIRPEEAAPEGYRLSSLRLAMSRPSVAPMTFVFAPRSRLVLNEDLTADWEFGV